MHPHQQAGTRADGSFVVAGMGAVGGADLVQAYTGTGHDVGNAKGAADLDQLTAGNDALLARAQAVERKQHGGCVVIDHGDRFGAGQLADQPFDQIVSVATLAGGKVELQVERITGGGLHGFNGFLRQQGTTEVSVQYRAGKVEDAAYLAALLDGQALAAAAQEDFSAQFGSVELAVANRFA
ncbi:hypothetical protein D3C81_1516710 [compost metagenome]